MINTAALSAAIAALPPEILSQLTELSEGERQEFIATALEKVSATSPRTTARMPFSTFKKTFWKAYKPAPYDEAIDKVLMGVADYVLSEGARGIPRAMILAPPRSGKTMRISRLFPAWMLTQAPDLAMIAASYGMRLAEKNTRWVRNLVQRREYTEQFPHVKLIGQASDQWETSEEGGMLAAGIGGAITGFGARLGIIDDPTRSRADAESPIIRQRGRDWYNDDFLPRIEEPGGAILVMATLWQTEDLPSWLLNGDEDELAEQWHVLKLPAIAEENDAIGRKPGAALWPARYPLEWLQKRRQKMGEYSFQALYQQNPIAKEASLFDTAFIKTVDSIPPLQEVVRFYDLAVSAKTTADYSAGLKLGLKKDGGYIVLDVYRRQAAPTQTAEAIILNAQRDGTAVKIRLEAENSARVQLDFLLRDPRLSGYTIDAKTPEGDKYTRATPAASRVNGGTVEILRGSWNRAFLDELSVFPSRAHDDQVDAFSGAYSMLSDDGDVITISYNDPVATFLSNYRGATAGSSSNYFDRAKYLKAYGLQDEI